MNLKVSQQQKFAIKGLDEFGNATSSFKGVPAWSLTDASLGALTIDADGMGALFVPSGSLGDEEIHVSAQTDEGSAAGKAMVTLLAGEARTIIVTPGEVSDAPDRPLPGQPAPTEPSPPVDQPLPEVPATGDQPQPRK